LTRGKMKNWQKMKIDPKFKEVQIKRSQIIDFIRHFFKKEGFLEVTTPILVKAAGQEPYLNPISISFYDEKNKKYQGYLITSPEYALKKLLAADFEKIFEITKVFRQNESFGGIHNPEFQMLEWYRAHSNYRQIMKDAENLIYFLNQKLNHKSYLIYQGQKINLKPPWPKISVKQAFLKYAKINLDQAKNIIAFRKIAQKRGFKIVKNASWDDIFYYIFLNAVEPKLEKNQPIIIYDYPLPQAALAKRKNSFYAERFEIYIGGLELANAFSELTDWKEQSKRFQREQKIRKSLHKTIIPLDNDFLNALKLGLPPSGGIALGIERLEMLLLNIKDINDLLPFPAKQMFN